MGELASEEIFIPLDVSESDDMRFGGIKDGHGVMVAMAKQETDALRAIEAFGKIDDDALSEAVAKLTEEELSQIKSTLRGIDELAGNSFYRTSRLYSLFAKPARPIRVHL